MLKKYAPYILLALAGLLLLWVKSHQQHGNVREQLELVTDAVNTNEGFSRQPEKITYTRHARCRMDCRHISEADVKELIQNGKLNKEKVQESDMGKTYPLDGKTTGDKMLRIVVAPKKNDLVVVTVIDLDTDWPCDCK